MSKVVFELSSDLQEPRLGSAARREISVSGVLGNLTCLPDAHREVTENQCFAGIDCQSRSSRVLILCEFGCFSLLDDPQ
jgi:hypothetical protein